MISGLGTADFIVETMQRMQFSPVLVPAFIFLFGAFVSFATGSSWGTFTIMMPLAIPMAHAFSIPYAVATGAVLSGGLFGDHCSPISDTTILSSTGAECDLVEHVKTQLPYAVVNGIIASTPSARRPTPQAGRSHSRRRISIHALREEGDAAGRRLRRCPSHFYPRPPRGGRPLASIARGRPYGFLSTPSARRATLPFGVAVDDQIISIHALREGGDGLS